MERQRVGEKLHGVNGDLVGVQEDSVFLVGWSWKLNKLVKRVVYRMSMEDLRCIL